jgi:helix-turn-helix, Psq domain
MSKRIYGKWTGDDIERAVSAVRRGDMGLSKSARNYGIPKATLCRHINRKRVSLCKKLSLSADENMDKRILPKKRSRTETKPANKSKVKVASPVHTNDSGNIDTIGLIIQVGLKCHKTMSKIRWI